MYRRPKFLEVLIDIRQEMARQSDYDVDLFAEMIRSDKFQKDDVRHNLSDAKNGADKAKTDAEF